VLEERREVPVRSYDQGGNNESISRTCAGIPIGTEACWGKERLSHDWREEVQAYPSLMCRKKKAGGLAFKSSDAHHEKDECLTTEAGRGASRIVWLGHD